MLSLKLPKKFFLAHKLMILAFGLDQQNQLSKARDSYMQAARMFAHLLKKYPKVPFARIWREEALLCLKRAKYLRFLLSKGKITHSTGKVREPRHVLHLDELKDNMRDCRVIPDLNLSFSDVIGLKLVVKEINKFILLPLKYPILLQTRLNSPPAILLFGPPGCGKTRILHALASVVHHWGVSVFNVPASKLLDKYVGESQKRIRALFEVAWENSPSIIYIDEFDGMFGSQTTGKSKEAQSSTATTTAIQLQKELMQYMDGMMTRKGKQTVLIAATNFPKSIERAQLRRFTRILYVHPPNSKAIRKLLEYLLEEIDHSLTAEDFHHLSLKFKGYTPDEIKKVCEKAFMNTYDEKKTPSEEPPRSLSCKDIDACLSMISPMLIKAKEEDGVSTLHFRRWNKDNGSPHIMYPVEHWEKLNYSPSDDIELKAAGLASEINYRESLRCDEEVL